LLKILSFLFYKYYIMTHRVEQVARNGLEINISATEGGANVSEIHVLAARLDELGGLVTSYRGGGYMGMEQW
jgi:hypothetical protein